MGKHVVLGAGQIGTQLATLLVAQGEEVVVVRRSRGDADVRGVTVMRGDLSDPVFAARVGEGASVVYQCTNPRYHRWPKELMPNTEGAIAAANANGARLVVLDCLYAYGDTGETPRSETTPMKPVSKKGELRRRMAERYAAAEREGLVVTLVRASDFVGAGLDQAVLGDRAMTRLLAGSSVEVLGDPDHPHAYTYAPDVAEALRRTALLEAPPFVIHVPTLPSRSTRVWVEALAAALGAQPKMLRAPRWVLAAMGLFDPMAGEIVEMLYQFAAPFPYDDTASRAILAMEPTPFEMQIAEIARATRAHAALQKAA